MIKMIHRDFTKTLTYFVMHFVVAVAVAYAISWDWKIAISIGIAEPIVQTVFYYFHEKVWQKLGNTTKVKLHC